MTPPPVARTLLTRRGAIRLGVGAGAISSASIAGGLAAVFTPLASGCAAHKPVHTAAPAPPVVTGAGSLRIHAEARAFFFGCAVDTRALRSDQSYAALVKAQAGIIVAENAMKWAPLRPSPTTYSFDEADALVSFAEANSMKVRGHNLCWYRQMPPWFASYATTANARDLLLEHIHIVAGRYAGRMHSWDVVNEAIEPKDGRPDDLRDSPWLRLVGPDYIETAFRAAREADGQALLAYNDYGLEAENPAAEAKRVAVLLLLRRLHARRVPLDAVGVQSHLTAGNRYGSGLIAFLAAVRDLGLQVFITELDVNDRTLPASPALRDPAVAQTYGEFLNLVLQEPAVRVVITWGLTDRHTWLNHEDARADKLPERSLPFGDVDGIPDQPKPAFFAVRNAFDARRTL